MFNIGELVVYSAHGVCKIDDICEKTYGGKTRTYYVLHPIDDIKLKINIPVNNGKNALLKMMDAEEAEKIVQSFNGPGIEWITDVKKRNKQYGSLVQSGNRQAISQVANTLMRRTHEAKLNNKHVSDQDRRLLTMIKNVLIEELALALHTSNEEISDRIQNELNMQMK